MFGPPSLGPIVLIFPLWVILSVICIFVQRRSNKIYPARTKSLTDNLIWFSLFVLLYLMFYGLSYMIPTSVMDYEWYRPLFRLCAPFILALAITYGWVFGGPLIHVKKHSFILRITVSSLVTTIYAFLVGNIAINYVWLLIRA